MSPPALDRIELARATNGNLDPPPIQMQKMHPSSALPPPTAPLQFPGRTSHDTSPASSPSSLRKAFSVDSFVRSSRPAPMNLSRSSTRNSPAAVPEHVPDPVLPTVSQRRPHRPDVATTSYQERDPRFPLSGRSRGASISSTVASSVTDSSDHDLSSSTDLGSAHPNLVLPSRLSPLPSPSSNSTLSGTSPHSDDLRFSPNTSHRWSSSRPGPSSPLSRSQSESLVLDAARTKYQPSAADWSDVNVVVVGSRGCGKSTVIAKGLKAYKLSEPTTAVLNLRTRPQFQYTEREGIIPREHAPNRVLRVLEVDSAMLDDPHTPGNFVWPEGAPEVNAAIVCYDVSQKDSVTHVEDLLRCFRDLKLPIIVFACKCDLERYVESHKVYSRINQLDVGLVEVNTAEESGKNQLRLGFDFVLRAVASYRAGVGTVEVDTYHNPASPDVLVSPPPWEISRASTVTPTAAGAPHSIRSSQALPAPVTPRMPNNDLNKINGDEHRSVADMARSDSLESGAPPSITPLLTDSLPSVDETSEERSDNQEQGRAVPWATLEELLDKLLFLAVSGDGAAYVSHFLLTYRRFASPRSVVLAMQKRMRRLDVHSTDPMFACFAQMRICHLLEQWIQDYPHDFAVGAAADALNALVKSIISKTHLLHYGSDFLPFLENRPLMDKDAAWAMKVDEMPDESDDSYNPLEEDEHPDEHPPALSQPTVRPAPKAKTFPSPTPTGRERKSSLPLTAKELIIPQNAEAHTSPPVDQSEMSPKAIMRELVKMSGDLAMMDSDMVAQEITRIEMKLFFQIEPRHWLQHVLVAGKKEPETDSIAQFSEVSNHLASWVISLILCHDKPRNRAKQIEKFVEIAARLRHYNNYSALRAFVAAINSATFEGDPALDDFQKKSPGLHKTFQSWELLLQSAGSHRAYRMALRNTKGACIPALEVHLLDLIRAHEGNTDMHPDDPKKIHWAKFNMMGKFIQSTKQYQQRCRNSPDYHFKERPDIRNLLMRECLMDGDLQRARISQPTDGNDMDERPHPTMQAYPNADRPRDIALIRKLLSMW